MTSILTTFDTRLARLEKSIYPLYTSTQILNRRAYNIDQALLKIDQIASDQEGVAAEEALILRGPQPGQLNVYKDALERLNASIAFKSSDRDSLDTARLVETGAKKLTSLYTKLVAECSSGSTPGPTTALSPVSISSELMNTLQPLVAFLRTLPQPSTHPSHPAASSIFNTLREAQKGYADMRGNWVKRCLEGQGKRVLDRADTIDVVMSGKEFGDWVRSLLDFAEAEHENLLELAPLSSPATIGQTYQTLLTPLLTLFATNLSNLTSLIKRSLQKYNFLALSAYDSLSSLQPRFESILSWRGQPASASGKSGTGNELKEGLNSLRAICLRSFPEILADIKLAALSSGPGGKGNNVGPGGEMSTGLADVTLQAVKYMERLPDVSGAAGTALLALGDGNWKMGEGVQLGKANVSKLGEGDEQIIIEHYTYDLVTTLVSTLTTLSKTNRRPSMGSVFLLNNISYLHTRILLQPANPSLPQLLSQPTRDSLKSAFRTAKAGYFDANFSPLMLALSEDSGKDSSLASGNKGAGGGGGGGKEKTKDKMTRFFDLLEEVVERHKLAKVLEDDEDERNIVVDEVVKLVVTTMKGFVNKHRDKEFSKNPQKYIKMSPEAVESQLRSIYR
jgi:exocyst complex protein 7